MNPNVFLLIKWKASLDGTLFLDIMINFIIDKRSAPDGIERSIMLTKMMIKVLLPLASSQSAWEVLFTRAEWLLFGGFLSMATAVIGAFYAQADGVFFLRSNLFFFPSQLIKTALWVSQLEFDFCCKCSSHFIMSYFM